METMETPKEVIFTIKLQPSLAEWLEQRATANRRARLREVEVILEEARAKETPAVGRRLLRHANGERTRAGNFTRNSTGGVR